MTPKKKPEWKSTEHLLRRTCGCEIGFTVHEEPGRPTDTHFLPCGPEGEGHVLEHMVLLLADIDKAMPELKSDLAIGFRLRDQAAAVLS